MGEKETFWGRRTGFCSLERVTRTPLQGAAAPPGLLRSGYIFGFGVSSRIQASRSVFKNRRHFAAKTVFQESYTRPGKCRNAQESYCTHFSAGLYLSIYTYNMIYTHICSFCFVYSLFFQESYTLLAKRSNTHCLSQLLRRRNEEGRITLTIRDLPGTY